MNSVGQYLAEVENHSLYGPRRGFHVDTEFWKRMDRERKARGSEPAPPSRESVIERALPAASEEMDRGDKASLELETGLDNETIQSAFDLIFSTLRNPDGTIHRSRSFKDKLRTLTSEPLLEQDNLAQLFIDQIESMGEEGLCIMMANDPQNIIYKDDGIPNGFNKSTTRANKVASKLPNERAVRLRVSGGLMYVEDYYMRESANASPGMSTTASKPPQLKLCYPVPGYIGGDMEPHSKATIELEARELKRISKMAPDYDMSPEEREEYLKMTRWAREKYLTMSPEKRDEHMKKIQEKIKDPEDK